MGSLKKKISVGISGLALIAGLSGCSPYHVVVKDDGTAACVKKRCVDRESPQWATVWVREADYSGGKITYGSFQPKTINCDHSTRLECRSTCVEWELKEVPNHYCDP